MPTLGYHIENAPEAELAVAFSTLIHRLIQEGLTVEALTALDDYHPEAAAIFAEKMRPFMNDAPAR